MDLQERIEDDDHEARDDVRFRCEDQHRLGKGIERYIILTPPLVTKVGVRN